MTIEIPNLENDNFMHRLKATISISSSKADKINLNLMVDC